jgi:DNA-directed RNA polymerase subunit RPC12/RpoP
MAEGTTIMAKGIKCPKCGAYLSGELPESISSVTCRYCSTTILIPEKGARQKVQPVVVVTRQEAREIKEYGKTLDDMTTEEKTRVLDGWMIQWEKEDLEELEKKEKQGVLRGREQRILAYIRAKHSNPNLKQEDYCLACYRKYETKYVCVACGKTETCGNKDCKTASEFVPNPPVAPYRNVIETERSAPFSLYCPKCGGLVCNKCYDWKEGSFLLLIPWGIKYRCRKCGSTLEKRPPLGRRWKLSDNRMCDDE